MISPERLDALQKGWLRLVQAAAPSADPGAVYAAFDRLIQAYQEPPRAYHTPEHLAEMFRVAARLPGGASPAVTLAIWFHDAVYDPRRGDNEEQSAALAAEELTPLGVPLDLITRVQALILTTDHRRPLDGSDAEAVALHDADLAILGASRERYRRYAGGIRHEYGHVRWAEYVRGRRAVLQSFLDRPAIYRHPAVAAAGEQAARDNLAWEAAELEMAAPPAASSPSDGRPLSESPVSE